MVLAGSTRTTGPAVRSGVLIAAIRSAAVGPTLRVVDGIRRSSSLSMRGRNRAGALPDPAGPCERGVRMANSLRIQEPVVIGVLPLEGSGQVSSPGNGTKA